jgi:protocatechuate 3,4-dioxygenase beta subunit
MENTKQYLGDSVYAEFNGFGIVLTTENGEGASNTIVLEPEVIRALDQFVNKVLK